MLYVLYMLQITFLVLQCLKNTFAVQEMWVRALGWEDALEKEMATYSSIFAWKIPKTEKPGGLQSMGLQGVGRHEPLNSDRMA